jgi:beta-aspartyl-peptidase (threonine type)
MKKSEHVFLDWKRCRRSLQNKMKLLLSPMNISILNSGISNCLKQNRVMKRALDHSVDPDDKKFGTVGAVACDANGNLAAATSTGGMTNKQFGRVGDSPIIGIGTYANNKTCAISCTGHGEPFIKAVAAYDVSCLMEYKGLSLEEAMSIVVMDKLMKIDGEGGMIGVDANGNASLIFNSEGMYRGFCSSDGRRDVAIYK